MLLLLASILPVTFAATHLAPFTHEVKEVFNAPAGWHAVGYPSPAHSINLQIGLHQPNFPVLEQHLLEVSDPDHPRYGEYLTKEEVEELVAPHDEALLLVNAWLEYYGIDESDIVRSSARDWIRVTLSVSLVEEMLDTVPFLSSEMTKIFLRCVVDISVVAARRRHPSRSHDELQSAGLLAPSHRSHTAHDDVWKVERLEERCHNRTRSGYCQRRKRGLTIRGWRGSGL